MFNIYKFLVSQHLESGEAIEEPLDAAIQSSNEPAALIVQHATRVAAASCDEASHGCIEGICAKTVGMFLRALGAECSNLALRYLPFGGCYIAGGGVAAKMKDFILDGCVFLASQDIFS